MTDPSDRLLVYLAGIAIGFLERPGPRRFRFAYDEGIVDQWRDTPLLSASLPVRAEVYPNARAKPYFEGLLPEGSVREALEREFRVAPGDGYGLLAQIGAECAGAVTIVPPGFELPEPSLARVDWLTREELATRIAQLPTHPLGVGLNGPRLSLGGIQHKLVVVRAPTGRIGLPVGGAPSTHIIKPGQPSYPDIAVNEAFCLLVAACTGLRAARTELLDVEGRPVLVVERFDRTIEDGMHIQRLHQEDLCQALGVLPEAKYESDGGPGIPAIVEAIRDASVAVAADITVFMRSTALNFLLGNSDAHAKNYAFLHEVPGAARLAPLYDVVCTQTYEVVRTLAMSIGDATEPGEVNEEAWRQAARACGLNEGLLIRDISGYAERVLRCAAAVREQAIAEGWHRPVIDQVITIAKQRAAQLKSTAQLKRTAQLKSTAQLKPAAQVKGAAPLKGAAPGAATASTPAPPSALDRSILYGRVYPYIYNPSIGGAETGLVARVAYAVAAAGIAAIRLGSSEQAAFEQAVGGSSIERWVNDMANTRTPPAWRATDPTRSAVVTVRRPAVPLLVDGWSVEARASVSTSPFGISMESPVLLFVADVVLRPTDSAAVSGRPLAPEDLFRLLWFLTTAAVEQVAPRTVESLPGRPVLQPLAFEALVTASGRPLGEFVPLEWFGKSRAEAALDATGGEWPVDEFDTLADREQRASEIRSWIESLHRESGWSGHEPGIAALPIPEE